MKRFLSIVICFLTAVCICSCTNAEDVTVHEPEEISSYDASYSELQTETEAETGSDNGEAEKVVLTVKNGDTVNDVALKLETNEVCSSEDFFNEMLNPDWFDKYDFLPSYENIGKLLRPLEGYIYPDSYIFYKGEDASSVVGKFLENFADNWTDVYNDRASELGYSAREIIILASIVEKDTLNDYDNPMVASVLHNRLQSTNFSKLECDSTIAYVESMKDSFKSTEAYNRFLASYSTFQTDGLPEGPVCCPGDEAISAALFYDDTDFYYFAYDDSGNILLADTEEQHYENLNKTEEYAVASIEMENGDIIKIELYHDIAPNTVNNFIYLAQSGYYDGLTFHRVIPGFMIQGGDPEGNGTGGPGYTIFGEFANNDFDNNLKHERGVISMARRGNYYDPSSAYNTAGSQFFIMVDDAPNLDGDYAAFGRCIDGLDVVDRIVSVKTDLNDKPLNDVVIKTITINQNGLTFETPNVIR